MELPLFPLNTVLFPQMPLALHIFEERYKLMIGRCIAEGAPFGVVLIREGSEVGMPAEPFDVGTTAQIVDVEKLQEGRMNIIATGGQRFRLLEVVRQRPYLVGRVEMEPHLPADEAQLAGTVEQVRHLFADYLGAVTQIVGGEQPAELPGDAAGLAYVVAAALQTENSVKQRLLSERSIEAMLCDEAAILPRETKRLKLIAAVKQSRQAASGGKIGPFSQN